jgi:hypothetical protein
VLFCYLRVGEIRPLLGVYFDSQFFFFTYSEYRWFLDLNLLLELGMLYYVI